MRFPSGGAGRGERGFKLSELSDKRLCFMKLYRERNALTLSHSRKMTLVCFAHGGENRLIVIEISEELLRLRQLFDYLIFN